jgi:hypothetical protein
MIFNKTMRQILVAVLVLLSFTGYTTAEPSTPLITITKAETIPGTMTRMLIEWEYGGTQTEDLHFRLTEGNGISVENPEPIILNSSARVTMINVTPGQSTADYVLEAVQNDFVIASVPFRGLIAQHGGFTSVEAKDAPYDGGGVNKLTWQINENIGLINEVRIYRNEPGKSSWEEIAKVDAAAGIYQDTGLNNHKPYNYLLEARGLETIYFATPLQNIECHAAWFDMGKINLLIIAIIVLLAIGYYGLVVKRKPMYVRKIAGLQAVEEAVGRATEMGRSVLYIPGIRDLDDVQTIAGLTILGSVARMTARYETKIDVPVCTSLVMSNGREVVKEAFMSVGRPDLYHDDIVHYITDEQFGYVAAVDGIMVREKPAACFYMGAFFAESLILAETGNHIGAIQIAGTAMPTQLPFFVAACDYTLIGEELFAASAYLSGDQQQIASLRGQDVGKLLAMGAIAIGSLFITLATFTSEHSLIWKLSDMFSRLFAMNY